MDLFVLGLIIGGTVGCCAGIVISFILTSDQEQPK